jgi:hypothetical protein
MPQQLEIKKHRMAQSTDGTWTLTVTLHPHDDIGEIVKAPVGFRWNCTLESADDVESAGALADAVKFAGVLCTSWDFQAFMFDRYGIPDINRPKEVADRTELCAEFFRQDLGIKSRKELATDKEALKRFDTLYREFKGWPT